MVSGGAVLFPIRYSPFAIRHSLFAIRHSLFATHYSPFAQTHTLRPASGFNSRTGSRSESSFQALVAFGVVTSALLNPIQTAVSVVGLVSVVLIAAGVCLLTNAKARIAATTLGITILLTVLCVYLPMLVRTPTDIVALNYFFDTMLFGGTILLLANAMDESQAVPAEAP